MTSIQRAVCGLSAGALAAVLTGCSVDTLIWGSDGARVIQTTEKLVSDLSSGETSEVVCMNSVEGLPEGAVPGIHYPGDVFYRETDDGLCVVDVAWVTLVAVG